MEEFIAKYWIEFAFGILIAVLGFFFKRYLKLEKDNAAHERAEFKAMLLEEVDKRNQAHCVTDQNLKDDIRRLKKGVLSF